MKMEAAILQNGGNDLQNYTSQKTVVFIFVSISFIRRDTQRRSQLKKQDALTTLQTYVHIWGTYNSSNSKSSSFPSKHILTSDDGHIGQNMLWILIFGPKVLNF
jgi:hypothetical protein